MSGPTRNEVFTAMREELREQGFTGYRFCVRTCDDSGDKRHAAPIIREWFPDASSAEAVMMADCVLFNTKNPRDDAPAFFIRLDGPWVHAEDVYKRWKREGGEGR